MSPRAYGCLIFGLAVLAIFAAAASEDQNAIRQALDDSGPDKQQQPVMVIRTHAVTPKKGKAHGH